MNGIAQEKQIAFYTDETGRKPFVEWVSSLRDSMGRKRILARLKRLQEGNYGDCKSIGGGISELRMFFGPGYRIYFGEHGRCFVVLLCGGDKDSQDGDIKRAQSYWKEFLNHAKNADT